MQFFKKRVSCDLLDKRDMCHFVIVLHKQVIFYLSFGYCFVNRECFFEKSWLRSWPTESNTTMVESSMKPLISWRWFGFFFARRVLVFLVHSNYLCPALTLSLLWWDCLSTRRKRRRSQHRGLFWLFATRKMWFLLWSGSCPTRPLSGAVRRRTNSCVAQHIERDF